MTSASTCPACSGKCVRYGTKERRLLELDANGQPLQASVRVQRWKCQACESYHTQQPALAVPRFLATIAVRDALANACFRAGYAPAALEFNVDEKTARAMFEAWAAPREMELPQRPPQFLGLHVASVAGKDRTVVCDVQACSVVDILPGADAGEVTQWMDRIGDNWRVDKVALALHQPFRDAMGSCTPNAQIMVCPRTARNHGMRGFLAALRAVRRGLGRAKGSNVRESARAFARRQNNLEDQDREEMSSWHDSVLDLYEAKERFMQALDCNQRTDAMAILGDAQAKCQGIAGAGLVANLVRNWAPEMATGAAENELDLFSELLDSMALQWARRRPTLSFDLARGLAVLADGPRMLAENHDCQEKEERGITRSLGVSMSHVAENFVLSGL